MAPAIAVVVILAAFQLASRKRWMFEIKDILPMTLECILLSIPLIVFSLFLSSSSTTPAAEGTATNISKALSIFYCSAPNGAAGSSLIADIVTGIGAGIYEELIFRLILICVLMMLFQDVLRLSKMHSVIFSVVISAALFSAHHHVFFINGHMSLNAPFAWPEFIFRTAAGIYFAIVFAIRGFGITAGTHAFYDIIATLINAMFFQQ